MAVDWPGPLINTATTLIEAWMRLYQARPSNRTARSPIIECSAHKLVQYLEPLRLVHREILVRALYKGNGVLWEGKVCEIQLLKNRIVIDMSEHDDPMLLISVTFSNAYVHEIERIRKGDLIRYYAEIVSVSPSHMILNNGKIFLNESKLLSKRSQLLSGN